MSKRHLAEVLKYDDGHAAARAEFKKIKDLIKLKEKVRPAVCCLSLLTLTRCLGSVIKLKRVDLVSRETQ